MFLINKTTFNYRKLNAMSHPSFSPTSYLSLKFNYKWEIDYRCAKQQVNENQMKMFQSCLMLLTTIHSDTAVDFCILFMQSYSSLAHLSTTMCSGELINYTTANKNSKTAQCAQYGQLRQFTMCLPSFFLVNTKAVTFLAFINLATIIGGVIAPYVVKVAVYHFVFTSGGKMI